MGQQARKGPVRAKRARFPLVPPFGDAACGGKIQEVAELDSSCLPVRCSACRSPSARAALPTQTCQFLQFIGDLNAAPSLCLVLCSLPEQPCRILMGYLPLNFPVLGRKRLTFGAIWDTIVLYAVTKHRYDGA